MAKFGSHLKHSGSQQHSDRSMILVFRRTGERRYAVEAQRVRFPNLVMDPAPGYNRLMPHDMMHLVVEAQLGITRGVFGQLAAGGDAGTFHLSLKRDESSREVVRAGNRVKERGKKLLKEGRDDSMRSERATYICWYEWLARSQSSARKKASQARAPQARQVKQTASAKELCGLNERKLDEICKHLDNLSSRWTSLAVGESIAVRWPDLAIMPAPKDL